MARRNRVVVYDGVYHVTTRIANRAMLLAPDEVKKEVLKWICSAADFSGVEVWGFTIMDNHLHLIVHVPPVPKKYWLDPSDEPCTEAFTMRPPEWRAPRWKPEKGVCPHSQPPLGFMLSDEEMVERLLSLYGGTRATHIKEHWEALRKHHMDALVEQEKERYCRRMYNLSQYLKTVKERVSSWYNEKFKHEGALWAGRFYSGILEKKHEVYAIVAAYAAYNPVKAGIVSTPAAWDWSSYALAVKGEKGLGQRCRAAYEKMFNLPWDEICAVLESIYADELPPGVSPAQLKEWYDDYDEDSKESRENAPVPTYRISQAIHASMKVFRMGAYISEDIRFLKVLRQQLPKSFPAAGKRAIKRWRAFIWELPERFAPRVAA